MNDQRDGPRFLRYSQTVSYASHKYVCARCRYAYIYIRAYTHTCTDSVLERNSALEASIGGSVAEGASSVRGADIAASSAAGDPGFGKEVPLRTPLKGM